MPITGAQAVVRTLTALDVKHVFGIVSVHNIPIYDVIATASDITPIAVRHEQAGVHMADAYARRTGKLGVAITSTGPGASNAMTGLFEAGFASSPVMMITGQVDTPFYGKGKGVLHEADHQLEMLRSITRRAESPRTVGEVPEAIVRAARDALTGRPQPTAVEIPIDLQYGEGDVDVPSHFEVERETAPAQSVQAAAAKLTDAQKVIIWAGGGVIRSGANDELVTLAEALDAPVVTSTNGRGSIPESHRLACGTVSPALLEGIADADVVLAIGTRFQGQAVANFSYEMPGELIHIDADPGVIGRNYAPAVAVVGDAKAAIAAVLDGMNATANDGDFVEHVLGAAARAREKAMARLGDDHRAIMATIRDLSPPETSFVRDATVPAYVWGNTLLPVEMARTSMHSTSAAIGPGLPLGIGAAIGGGKSVVIQGDGGFMLHIGELATAAQFNVPVVVLVFNDGGYGVLRRIQGARFEGRTTGVDLATPDFVKVAEAMGVTAEGVVGIEQFREAFARAIEHDGPYLLDIDLKALAPLNLF